jgi:hypothetical protein
MKTTIRSCLLMILVGLAVTLLASVMGGMAAMGIGLELPHLPDGSTPAAPPLLLALLGALVLVAGMVPLAAGLALDKTQKAVALFLFLAWCYVGNTVMEAHLFSTLGGEVFTTVSQLFTATALAITLAALAPAAKSASPLGGQLFTRRRVLELALASRAAGLPCYLHVLRYDYLATGQ